VTRIQVKAAEVEATDAAEFSIQGRTREIRRGSRIPVGGVLLVHYPQVQLHILDSEGSRFVLECAKCSPEEPLLFTVGDPDSEVPYKQQRGNVSYDIEKQEDGWFKIMLEVLQGPDSVMVPVAVRGTRFMLEPNHAPSKVTVAEGVVEVEGNIGEVNLLVEGGSGVTGGPGAFVVGAAESTRLLYLADVLGPTPTMYLQPGSAQPTSMPDVSSIQAPSSVGKSTHWASWVVIGAGVATAAAGGAVHYLAYRAEYDVAAEAAELCGPLATNRQALAGGGTDDLPLSPEEHYNQLYDDRVSTLETSAWVLYGTGVALMASGVVWRLLRDPGSGKSPPLAWEILPLPDGGFSLGTGIRF